MDGEVAVFSVLPLCCLAFDGGAFFRVAQKAMATRLSWVIGFGGKEFQPAPRLGREVVLVGR